MNTNRHHLLLTLLVAMSALAASDADAQTSAPRRGAVPKVVINILVDQLRSDYLEAFAPLYGEDGLQRLLQDGCVYTQAEYPMARTDRASAVATVATGTVPADHGIVGGQWMDRATLRPVHCCQSEAGIAPTRLSVSTIGDELKIATEGKAHVIAIAPWSEAAVLAAGHAADAAVWIDAQRGVWTSSAYYGGHLPAWAAYANQRRSIAATLQSTTWRPTNDLVGNFSYFLSGGMKQPFAHRFAGNEACSDFLTSGLVNDEIAQVVADAIASSAIGTDAIPDYISVVLYAGGFRQQPASLFPMEQQDIYVRLDRAVATILRSVEQKVGTDNALITLTSTGYTAEQTSDLSRYRIPTGTFNVRRAAGLLGMYLTATYGQGAYVETTYGSEIYLSHKVIEDKGLNYGEVLGRCQDFLLMLEGVKDVYTSQRLLQGAWTPGIARYRSGYHAQRSGDILIHVTPGWTIESEYGSKPPVAREGYIPFPIIFYGNAAQPQHFSQSVSTDRIAPTIAKSIRIRAPNASAAAPLF